MSADKPMPHLVHIQTAPTNEVFVQGVTRRLAQAIEQSEAAHPSADSHEFNALLADTLTDLALQDVLELEQLSGVDFLQRLSALQALGQGEVTAKQAQWLGAFEERAIGLSDCDEARGLELHLNSEQQTGGQL